MSYQNPTPHEIRMSRCLQKVMTKTEKLINRLSDGKCAVFIWCTPMATVSQQPLQSLNDAPVANYVANIEREGAAITMMELIAKWQLNGDLPPLHEMKDASGRTFDEILGLNGTH